MLFCELRGAASHSPRGSSRDSPTQKPLNSGSVFFEIDTNSGDLVRVLVRDPGGVGIEFSFTHWRMDPQVPDSLFRFDVPKGVAIVNGELPAGQGRVNR
jgi:outer membrane lipoprotein-sorting protein